nr:MAG TPA: hypothetical protein [Caudoviricetes sp.]
MRLGGGSCGACARVAARAVPVHFSWHATVALFEGL